MSRDKDFLNKFLVLLSGQTKRNQQGGTYSYGVSNLIEQDTFPLCLIIGGKTIRTIYSYYKCILDLTMISSISTVLRVYDHSLRLRKVDPIHELNKLRTILTPSSHTTETNYSRSPLFRLPSPMNIPTNEKRVTELNLSVVNSKTSTP